MKVKVLVYRGDPAGAEVVGVMGHIIGTTYTFQISPIDPVQGLSQAGGGFVFAGSGGVNDGDLYFSDGSGASQIVLDANGNSISYPFSFSRFGSESLFLAATASVPGSSTGGNGGALFITDGGGTPTLLLPFEVQEYHVLGDLIYAVGTDQSLHRVGSDGNNAELLIDLLGIAEVFEFGGDLWFRGSTGTTTEYYRVDHDTGDVTRVDGIYDNPTYFDTRAITSEGFYFWQARDSSLGLELYVSDGTAAGTRLVKDINPGSGHSVPPGNGGFGAVALGEKIIFLADGGGQEDTEIWVSDGTANGTFVLTGQAAIGSNVGNLGEFARFAPMTVDGLGLTFFQATSEEGVAGLYATDGTRAGTRLVRELDAQPGHFHTDGNLLYFRVGLAANSARDEVWVSDGTTGGTFIVSDADAGFGSAPSLFSIVEIDVLNLPTTFEGTGEDDVFIGFDSHIDQTFLGRGGDDTITPDGGSDEVDGGTGSDTGVLAGLNGAGHDIVSFGGTIYALDRVDVSVDSFMNVEFFFNPDTNVTIGAAQIEVFAALDYAASYDDLALAFRTNGEAAFQHYLSNGFFEGREVSFDVAQYLANWSDLQAGFGTNLSAATQHFLAHGVDEKRLAEDPLDYIASYVDLIGAFAGRGLEETKAIGLGHYWSNGQAEGRRTGIDFDAGQYLENYADLRSAFGFNGDLAAWHFINSGRNEHRLADDPLDYIASYADLIGAFGGSGASLASLVANGLSHYQSNGFDEGRATDLFDVDTYLANYADLRAAFADGTGGYNEDAAMLHFIQYGFGEGRTDDVLIA